MERRLLRWFRGLLESKALTHANAWALLFSGYGTASSVSVSPDNILKCPAARGAVAVLAESVAQLPLLLYSRGQDGSKERATSHPLYEILHDQANDWTSSFEFRRQAMVDLLLSGNAFSYLNRSRATGQIVELVRIPPSAVVVELDPTTLEPRYEVTDAEGVRRPVDRADLLHLAAIGSDPPLGRSPLLDIRESIGLSLAMETHASKLFANGARPAGVLELAGRVSPQQLASLRESFSEIYGGAAKSGKTAVLEQGSKFTPLTMASTDAQFLELRRFQVAEIARALRIPLHLLGDWERATWSNAETAGSQFLSFTLLPWLKLWEGAIRRALLSPTERSTYYAEL
jgi:HK97 family phage portal protein